MRIKNLILNPHHIVKPIPKHILNPGKLIDESTEVYNDKGSRGTQVCHKRRDKTKKLRDSIAYYAIVYLNHKLTNFGR